MLNNGNGAFQVKTDYPAGDAPRSVFSADFDADGDMDLATANWGSDNASVLLNNGDGTFQDKTDYPAGDGPWCVFSSDLDADGDMDLAVANSYSDNISIFLNRNTATNIIIVGDKTYFLSQNIPNPFSNKTLIQYHIPEYEFVQIDVYSITGQKVSTLVNEYKESGVQEVIWNAEGYPSGIYFTGCRSMILSKPEK